MSLSPGLRTGPYEIVSLLGAGGMGEVYRARDTRLHRDVALKVLPDLFATDRERLTRLEREAQALAALSHTNIAAIYGLQEGHIGLAGEDGQPITALVMELVEGQTLADRVAQGAIPLEDALAIARQIAEALEAAHEQGVVHRDLKPANIKVRPDGTVKVLDFGLAKLSDPPDSARIANVTHSPTLTMQATFAGTVLGTASYMSPEQAKGKPVDRRADIWAFGVVLVEILTGRQMYEGETAPEILARVIEREPDLSSLPKSTPESIRALLLRCLTKDPRRRLQAIGEARIAIDRALSEPTDAAAPVVVTPALVRRSSPVAWVASASAVAALVAAVIVWSPWRVGSQATVMRLTIDPGVDRLLATDSGPALALSPDGQMLAFVAAQQSNGTTLLYLRRFDQLTATPVSGTEDARNPFFSPNGEWVAFFAAGRLKKIAVAGGAPITLCDAETPRGGGYWSDDNTITFLPVVGGGAHLVRVSANGGQPQDFLAPDQDSSQRWPQILPDGKAILYTKNSPQDGTNLVVQPLPAGERRVIEPGASFGRYVSSGHLVFYQNSTLFAVPFDLDRLSPVGTPVPVVENVAGTATGDAAQASLSADGKLAYLAGLAVAREVPIDFLDRSGKVTSLLQSPIDWSNPQFSPDGQQLAVDVNARGNIDVMVYDVARGSSSRVTTDDGRDFRPIWSPDGKFLVFGSTGTKAAATFNLWWRRADLSRDVQRLTNNPGNQMATSWHPSGKVMAYNQQTSAGFDIMMLPLQGDATTGLKAGTPVAFVAGPFNEQDGVFSLDGNFVAYTSGESGRTQVYVRPYPGPGAPYTVTTDGGVYPVWSRTSDELLFATNTSAGLNQNPQVMSVSYRIVNGEFRADKPKVWSPGTFALRPRQNSFALHPDGSQVAVDGTTRGTFEKDDKLVLVLNFFDELKRLAPTRR